MADAVSTTDWLVIDAVHSRDLQDAIEVSDGSFPEKFGGVLFLRDSTEAELSVTDQVEAEFVYPPVDTRYKPRVQILTVEGMS